MYSFQRIQQWRFTFQYTRLWNRQTYFRPVRSVEELLIAHPINDVILGCTDPSDVFIDTVDNTEIIASSHTMEE